MGRRQAILVGNWKMNGRRADLGEVVAMAKAANAASPSVEVVACPPLTLLALAADAVEGSSLKLGAQTVRAGGDGAFTGDVNADMLADAGAAYCIVGHSERRQYYRETDAYVRTKAEYALGAGLSAIVCVGESWEQRETGQALDVVTRQTLEAIPEMSVERVVVAYEPVWAIGAGETPSVAEIGEVHRTIRRALERRFGRGADSVRVLYGGSVKPANAQEIFAADDVDGALVGGAGLKAADFNAILERLLERERGAL
jgi:triosephosphate isomerase (TIM)